MAALSGNAYYRENQITTASRGQLLLMVYDGMIRFLAEAKRSMAEKRYEQQNTAITKTQQLILELVNTLDYRANVELAGNLDRLYRFWYDQLTEANISENPQILDRVSAMIVDLRGTWEEANRIAHRQESQHMAGGLAG